MYRSLTAHATTTKVLHTSIAKTTEKHGVFLLTVPKASILNLTILLTVLYVPCSLVQERFHKVNI